MSQATLQKKVIALKGQVTELSEALQSKERENQQLRERIAIMERRFYSPRSEKLSPGQLQLEFAEEEEGEEVPPHVDEAPDDEDDRPKRAPRGRHGRKPLPGHLRRERVEIHPENTRCAGCGAAMAPIGEKVTEELEYVPASLFIREHARIQYACSRCQEGVTIAALPSRPVEKGRPGPGLLAHVVVSKYGDHLPLNRQAQIFKREGVSLSRSTLCDWIADAADLALPVYRELKQAVLRSPVIQTDDTYVTMQENGRKGKPKRCFLWVYRGGDGTTVMDFTTNRSRAGPMEVLKGYRGYLQADAYAGYHGVYATGRVVEVGCWAHARRHFYEALVSAPEIASVVLAGVRRLYQVEREAKEQELDAERIHALRQERSVPILDDLHEVLQAAKQLALPTSVLGKAVGYALGNWVALKRYTEDGRLDIDNNAAERAMRKVAVGRKNWMFTGSQAGGKRAAILYSLIRSCEEAGVEPFAYLRDLFERVATQPANRMAELMPAAWQARQKTGASQAA